MRNLTDYIKLNARHVTNNDENTPVDKTDASEEEIMTYFRNLVLIYYKPKLPNKEHFYGGITGIERIESNLSRHHIHRYLGCVEVKSADIAANIEKRLCSELDVYIGKHDEDSAGNGGNDKSIVVYLADRTQKGFVD